MPVNLICTKQCLLMMGIVWFIALQSVQAKTEGADVEEQWVGSSVNGAHLSFNNVWEQMNDTPKMSLGSINGVDFLRLREIEQPLTTVGVWIEQLAQTPVMQIIGVQLNATETGLEVVLSTTDGSLETPYTSVVENALIVDIPNAVLNLPDGEEFQSVNPVEGIARVMVSNLPGDRVSLAVTGSEAPPTAEVRAESQALIVSLFPPELGDAQQAEVDDETDENRIQIVVTAERTEADIQDVPISITALTREEIEDADIPSLSEIAANTPNFSVFSGAGQNRSFLFYSVRGLGNSNFFSSDAVGFYVDDVPIDTSFSSAFLDLNLIDLERIEVLRGPQSTLYGRNTQAGAVNIITRPPTNVFELNSILDYGRFNDANVRTSLSGPIVKDQLSFRLSGSYASRDGYIENAFLNSDVDEQSGWTGRGQLLWTPSEDWDISLNASVDAYEDGALAFVFPDQSEPFRTERDFDGFSNLDANAQSLRIEYNHPSFRITSISARRFSQVDRSSDLDLTPADILQGPVEFDTTVWTQEVRLQSPGNDESLQWLAGGYFEARDFQSSSGLRFGADAFSFLGFPPGTDLANGETETTIFGIFGQVSYQPIEPLTLTAGLRYENTDTTLVRLDREFTPQDGFPETTFSARDVEQTSDAILPRFAAQYRFNPNLMVYGSVTRGFKPAGVNVLASNDVSLTFEEERSWNYELGLRSSWLNDRLAVNFTFFHNPVEGYQVVFFDGPSGLPSEVANADVRVTGFELEARATPINGLDLIAGFGLADARFTDFSDPVSGVDFDGNRVPFAPEFTYNLAVQYRSPIGLLGRVELQSVGTTFFDDENALREDAYAIVNARLGYEFDIYGVYLFANNIFDNRYLTYITPPVAGDNLAFFGTPATYGVQLRARF